MTAAEIIKSRANASLPHMGLTTWKNASTGGKILVTDVTIAKNYLTKKELDELNTIVSMYLDFAELQAKRQRAMKMQDWIERLDAFLQFNQYDILTNAGKVKASVAKAFAEQQFETFRVVQDREWKSDFDKAVEAIRSKGELPKETEVTDKSSQKFNREEFKDLNATLKETPVVSPSKKKKDLGE